jgi:CheY-like chemotaxis protein
MSAQPQEILVIEDNRTFLRMIDMVLKEAAPNHRILTASSVAEGLERAKSRGISIFIIDVHLPDGTGLELLARIRLSHPEARAIVMTSSPEADHRDMAHQFGAIQFLAKPIHLKRFAGLIRSLVEGTSGPEKISNLGVAEIIDMQCLALSSSVVVFHGPRGRTGEVAVHAGNILGARTGNLSGCDALQELLGWRKTEFELRSLSDGGPDGVNLPWKDLRPSLIDATRASSPAQEN